MTPDLVLRQSLLERGLDAAAIQQADYRAACTGSSLGAALVARGLLTEDELADLRATIHGLPKWNGVVDVEGAAAFGRAFCRREIAVPVERRPGRWVVAVADPPVDPTSLRTAAGGAAIDLVVAAESAILRAVDERLPWPTTADSERDDAFLQDFARAGGPTHLRVEHTEHPRILVKAQSAWTSASWIPSPVGRGAVADQLAHLSRIAAFDDDRAPMLVRDAVMIGVRSHDGSNVLALTFARDRTERGDILVVEPTASIAVDETKDPRFAFYQARASEFDALLERDQFDEAAALLERLERQVVEIDGRAGRLFGLTRELAYRLAQGRGRLLDAFHALEELLATPLPDIRVYSARLAQASLLRRHGTPEEARPHTRAALAIANDLFGGPSAHGVEALCELAYCQLDSGDLGAAEATSDALAAYGALLGGLTAIYGPYIRGLVARTRGDYAAACTLLEQAVARYPKDMPGSFEPEILCMLGDSARRAERSEVMRSAFDRARRLVVDLAPGDPMRLLVERELGAKGAHPYRN